jgi:hypothetical protein
VWRGSAVLKWKSSDFLLHNPLPLVLPKYPALTHDVLPLGPQTPPRISSGAKQGEHLKLLICRISRKHASCQATFRKYMHWRGLLLTTRGIARLVANFCIHTEGPAGGRRSGPSPVKDIPRPCAKKSALPPWYDSQLALHGHLGVRNSKTITLGVALRH